MAKTSSKDGSEIRYLQGEVRRLNKIIRHLESQVKSHKRYEHMYEVSQDDSDVVAEQSGDAVSPVLSVLGWITILIGFAIGFFALSDRTMSNSLGGLSVFAAIMLSSPIVVSGILLLAASSIVKSTWETARNTKKMLDIMQQ